MNSKEKVIYSSDYVCKYMESLGESLKKIKKEFQTEISFDPDVEMKHGIGYNFNVRGLGVVQIYLTGYFLILISNKEKKRPIVSEDVSSAFSYLIQYLKGLDSL